MPGFVSVEVAGTREVGLRFDAFPDALHEALAAEIGRLGEELLALVEAATPSRTGQLRSEERLRAYDEPERIKAEVTVSAEQAKAGALEYGAHRATAVRAHQMRLDHAWARRLAAPIEVLVGAYTRVPDIAERAFERGPLDAMTPEILDRLDAVVASATEAANG